MMKFLVLFAFVAVGSAQVPRVKVDIFYSALCPDTFAFINQLRPLYNEFSQNLAIMFVPFGKANSTRASPQDNVTFTCQRGEPECFGNRVQGCILSRLSNQDDQVGYILCQMSTGAEPGHQACAEASGLNWSEIQECAASDFAVNQQLTFEQISQPIIETFDWVPTVVYNGKVTENSHTGLAPPLREVLCSLLNNANPGCN